MRVAPLEVDGAPERVRRVVGGRVRVHLASAIRAVRVARDVLQRGAVRLTQAPLARVAVLASVLIQLVLVFSRVEFREELVPAHSTRTLHARIRFWCLRTDEHSRISRLASAYSHRLCPLVHQRCVGVGWRKGWHMSTNVRISCSALF